MVMLSHILKSRPETLIFFKLKVMFMLQRVLDKVLTKWLQLCSYFIHSQMPKLVMLLPTNSILLPWLYSDSKLVILCDVYQKAVKISAWTSSLFIEFKFHWVSKLRVRTHSELKFLPFFKFNFMFGDEFSKF